MSKLNSALLVSAVAAMLAAGSAQAHSALIASTPAALATVAAPSTIELHYNEKLKAKSRVELFMTGTAGKPVGSPAQIGVSVSVSRNGKTLVAKPQKPLAKGSYLIAWHVIAADGDRTDGTVRFAVR